MTRMMILWKAAHHPVFPKTIYLAQDLRTSCENPRSWAIQQLDRWLSTLL